MTIINIILSIVIAGLAGTLAALWSRVGRMHDNLVEAAHFNGQEIDRWREKHYELSRMVGHLADNFGLQYQVTPEQGRWKPIDRVMAQGYCADGSGELVRKEPEWREHAQKLHQELAARHVELDRRISEVMRMQRIDWEGMHERLNELAVKIEALPKPRVRTVKPRSRRS